MEELKQWCVYMHTNKINDKKYIGITHLSPELRWLNGKGYQNQLFGRAIDKYGWDNFKHDILHTELSQYEAEQIEIDLISLYNTTDKNFGYNVATGGNIGESSRNRLSKTIYQYDIDGNYINCFNSVSDAAVTLKETPCKISLACRYGLNHISCGYRWSYQYQGEKLNKSQMQNSNYRTEIHQYDIDGNYISSYESIMEAERITGISNSKISACAKGKNAYTKNFRWSYVYYEKLEPFDKNKYMYEKVISPSEKEIYQYTKDGKFIKGYKSMSEAYRETGISFKQISLCRNGKRKSAGGYKWLPSYMGENLNQGEINELL